MDDSVIPAASITDVDLAAVARVDPDAAVEIARIGDLLNRGKETAEDFFRLVRLLHRVGQFRQAEYLLRRNFEIGEGGFDLYLELFGTTRQEEFSAAIEAFREQFALDLNFIESRNFLNST
jgi:hypothetical protein